LIYFKTKVFEEKNIEEENYYKRCYHFFINHCYVVWLLLFQNRSIANKAIPVAEQFLKEQYGVDVEFYDYQVNAAYVTSTIILYGRIHGEKDKAFTIFVDYRTYKVILALVPPEYDPPNLND
jgi:hypothetical protein